MPENHDNIRFIVAMALGHAGPPTLAIALAYLRLRFHQRKLVNGSLKEIIKKALREIIDER